MTAFCNAVFAAAPFRTTGRRLLLWSKIAEQPAVFVRELGADYERRTGLPAKVMLDVEIWVYSKAGQDPDETPSAALNKLLDAIDTALAPDNVPLNTLTLGGLVTFARIEGKILYDPGDLDGQAKAVIPVKILAP